MTENKTTERRHLSKLEAERYTTLKNHFQMWIKNIKQIILLCRTIKSQAKSNNLSWCPIKEA